MLPEFFYTAAAHMGIFRNIKNNIWSPSGYGCLNDASKTIQL